MQIHVCDVFASECDNVLTGDTRRRGWVAHPQSGYQWSNWAGTVFDHYGVPDDPWAGTLANGEPVPDAARYHPAFVLQDPELKSELTECGSGLDVKRLTRNGEEIDVNHNASNASYRACENHQGDWTAQSHVRVPDFRRGGSIFDVVRDKVNDE